LFEDPAAPTMTAVLAYRVADELVAAVAAPVRRMGGLIAPAEMKAMHCIYTYQKSYEIYRTDRYI
jgi:hypothetical protein